MAKCDWCKYSLNSVYPNFEGYTCFDEYGYSLRQYFCSINCSIAYVNFDNEKSDFVIDKRVDWIYKIYEIRNFVSEAKKPNKLIVNGGYLSYDEYREGFCCPKPKDYNGSSKINYSVYQNDNDYDEEIDDYDYLQEQHEEAPKEREGESENED
jgi:hypothetical protein